MIEIVNLGLIDYQDGLNIMKDFHKKAVENDKNYLLICQHYDIYTVGQNEDKNFPVSVIKTDRGGSITFHGPGQPIFYFIFKVKSPIVFYKKVVKSFDMVFKPLCEKIYHDFKNPGFYIENRKLASIGFKYSKGYSLHGVAVNHSVDLDKFNLIKPCNLDGYIATSLINEGIGIELDELVSRITNSILKNFQS